jgi:transposase
MPQNFIACDREQVWLLPPSVRDWLPEDHLAWTVLDAVDELDLTGFYSAYRADGHGRPAYEPSMMVALLLYAYARGNRSSRRIERSCVEDVAYRVIAGNLVPDHSTIAEFRARHEDALAELFGGVLGLCARAGLVSVGVIAIDGTKVLANASHERNVDYRQLAERILAEADRIDREEDELYGEARGDELPEQLRTAEGRRAALRRAKQELEREQAGEPIQGRAIWSWSLIQSGWVRSAAGGGGAGRSMLAISLMSIVAARNVPWSTIVRSGYWRRAGGWLSSTGWRSTLTVAMSCGIRVVIPTGSTSRAADRH